MINKLFQQAIRPTRGQALVEMAIVAPVFFVLIMAIIASVFWTFGWNSMQYVATSTARAASVQTNQSEATEYTLADQAAASAISKTIWSGTTINYICGTTGSGCPSGCPGLPAKQSEIIVCILPQAASSANTTPTVTVTIEGWINDPIPLPNWGNFLPIGASDTQSQQVLECDQGPGGCETQ